MRTPERRLTTGEGPDPRVTQRKRILIVEDDASIGAALSEYLQSQGFATTVLMNGLHVEPEVRRAEPALVLLDVTLPGLDGLEVCHQLRRFSAVPIIMLSARDEEIDRALGLELGADDYVCKPFGTREILARIKAQLRRAEGRLGASVSQHGFRVDDAGRRIAFGEAWLPLTPQEYRLLRKLLSRPGHLFTREDLLDPADDGSRAPSDRAVDSHVKNLRRKLAPACGDAVAIVSVYGAGYRLEATSLATA
ncbi:response regulator [Ramlibacter algicola]|uniref:Response regulator n=1 Tax=Ramlibacter algicola TaxID=2795217 RepID=A0A934Q0Y1_9BURK|nr:response regulator [Ramlibacter algicola]MBK0393120.1 response regulator [Ramlibacter algicola]